MDFPSTRWTVLAQASLHGDSSAEKALEAFCLQYRPLVIKLLLSRGVPPDRAEDMAHDFLLQLMNSSALKRADQRIGRFRSFLCGALKKFLADDVHRQQAAKRGGGLATLSLDAAGPDAPEVQSSEDDAALFLDREWALHLVARAIDGVRQHWASPEKAARFSVIRAFLPGASESITQQDAAARLGVNDDAFRKELQRVRESVRSAIRCEVAATVASPEEIADEMRHLMRVLQEAPATPQDSSSQTRCED